MTDFLNSDRMERVGRLISKGINCGDYCVYVGKFRQEVVIFDFDRENDLFVVKQFLFVVRSRLLRKGVTSAMLLIFRHQL
jgi:hypothetical protein